MQTNFLKNAFILMFFCSVINLASAQNLTSTVAETETQKQYTQKYIVAVVAIFENPNDRATKVGNYNNGDKIKVYRQNGNWARVETVDGVSGWVKAEHIADKQVRNSDWSAAVREVKYFRKEFANKNKFIAELEKEAEKNKVLQRKNLDLDKANLVLKNQINEIQTKYEFSLKIEDQNNQLLEANAELNSKLNIAENKVRELQAGNITTYYFHGALIMLMGVILAWIAPRMMLKRRNDNWL